MEIQIHRRGRVGASRKPELLALKVVTVPFKFTLIGINLLTPAVTVRLDQRRHVAIAPRAQEVGGQCAVATTRRRVGAGPRERAAAFAPARKAHLEKMTLRLTRADGQEGIGDIVLRLALLNEERIILRRAQQTIQGFPYFRDRIELHALLLRC